MSMTVADDAIIEAENQVNFNWARTLPSHRAATHTMYALALGNAPSPAGLIGMLTIKLDDGRTIEVPTERSWETAGA